MTTKIKICGLTSPEAIDSVVKNGADYIGFVFFQKSPRNISPQMAAKLSAQIPSNVKKVAVLVNADNAMIDGILKYFSPDILQCHGSETLERISEIKSKYQLPVIKAISVRSDDDISIGAKYASVADMLLFDAKSPATSMPGGNGLAFDWKLLQGREFNVPWFLSGGLNIQNVNEALDITGAPAVDASSSLESEPGKKDPGFINIFIQKVKNYAKH